MPGHWPSLVNTSLWHTPQAFTLMRTSPVPGFGISRSTISKSAPGLGTCAAFIIVAMSPPTSFNCALVTLDGWAGLAVRYVESSIASVAARAARGFRPPAPGHLDHPDRRCTKRREYRAISRCGGTRRSRSSRENTSRIQPGTGLPTTNEALRECHRGGQATRDIADRASCPPCALAMAPGRPLVTTGALASFESVSLVASGRQWTSLVTTGNRGRRPCAPRDAGAD